MGDSAALRIPVAKPAWQVDRDKRLVELDKALRDLPEPCDFARAKLAELVAAKKLEEGSYKADLKAVEGALLTAMLKALKDQVPAIADSKFKTLAIQARREIIDKINTDIDAAKTVDAAGKMCEGVRAAAEADFQKAIDLQRSPNRAAWMKHLNIAAGSWYQSPDEPDAYRLPGEICSTHFTVSYTSANDLCKNIHGKTPQEVLKLVFIDDVNDVLQAHATLSRDAGDSKSPHLYLGGKWLPTKELAGGAHDAPIKAILQEVYKDMGTWLTDRIKTMQAKLG